MQPFMPLLLLGVRIPPLHRMSTCLGLLAGHARKTQLAPPVPFPRLPEAQRLYSHKVLKLPQLAGCVSLAQDRQVFLLQRIIEGSTQCWFSARGDVEDHPGTSQMPSGQKQ